MVKASTIQSRVVMPEIRAQVRGLMAGQPDWSRRRPALELCRQWQWRNVAGQIKDKTARSFLDKLERLGWIELPPANRAAVLLLRPGWPALPASPSAEVKESLAQLRTLRWQVFSARQPQAAQFNAYLVRYHYLPCRSTVAENPG